MATYVFSDIHGHYKALERLLERLSIPDEDDIWILGDMVDRGTASFEVMKLCHSLSNAHVLMGNHESMMLDCVQHPGDDFYAMAWTMNGGDKTRKSLDSAPMAEVAELIEWTRCLPLGAHVNVGDRAYLLVHAGLRSLNFSSRSRWTDATMDALLRYQHKEDMLWIRDEFWGRNTGFLDEEGKGPIVIAGHTPVPYIPCYTDHYDRGPRDEEGNTQMMHLGACEATGGVADRWAIDCGAAGGADWGSIGIVRLDDGEEFYEPVLEDD